jgi:hypothetical protein
VWAGVLALGLVGPAGGGPAAEAAQALDVLVRCPNQHETYQNWPHNGYYSAGRTEIRFRVLVDQPANYRMDVLSPAPFQMAVTRERAGQFQQAPQLGGAAQETGTRYWGRSVSYSSSGRDDGWIWLIVRPSPGGPPEYLVTLRVYCDGPGGGGGGGNRPPPPGCRWEEAAGALGTSEYRCICNGRYVDARYCRG